MRASDVTLDEIKQGAASPRGLLPALTVAIFLSAALLFAVQPMFTKMVLPRLGGSPQVWTVAMVFFQATLLAGYAYARALTRLAPLRVSILTHLAVMIAGCPLLPLAIASGWARPPAGHEAGGVLTLFGVSIGLPFFALAANAPLLQAWFARTDHPAAKDPYFLYAASNVLRGAGRLCTRSRALSAANGSDLLVVGRLLSPDRAHCSVRLAVVACRRPSAGARHIGNDDCPVLARRSRLGRARGGSRRPPCFGHRAHFDRHRGGAVALGHPSVALSSHLRRRIRAPADHPAHRRDAAAADCRFHPCDADVVLSFRKDSDGRCRTSLGVLRQRADVPRRTRAPASGAGVLDVVLLVAFARRHDRRGADRSRRAPRLQLGGRISATDLGRGFMPVPKTIVARVFRYGWVAASLLIVVFWNIYFGPALAVAALLLRIPLVPAIVVAGLLLHNNLLSEWRGTAIFLRSFFGVHRITEAKRGQFRELSHGLIVHGAQRLRDTTGRPEAGRPHPLAYYFSGSPFGQVTNAVRARVGGPIRYAVVGLGTGALACHAWPNDTVDYYEIDPVIVRIARDPALFS